MTRFGAFLLLASASALPAVSAELTKPALAAFDSYIAAAEGRMERERRAGEFLWVDGSPERLQQARQGQLVIAPWNEKGDIERVGVLIHDWVGAVFVPHVTMARTLAWVQDYPHHERAYRPEVLASRLLSREGNRFRTYLRLSKKKVITVVLNTEHDVQYSEIDPSRWYSRSYSTKIAEVENPGKPDERELPEGRDHGFLWRLYSYWEFQERDGGVYVECRAISLTRNVPTGLGWIIEPIIRELPKQSLENTLRSTRDAILNKQGLPVSQR